MKNKNLELIGHEDGWQVFRNSDGFLEGFKKIGKLIIDKEKTVGKDLRRIVTNQTTLDGFAKFVRGMKSRRKLKDVPVKISDLPSLFENEDF